MHYNAVGRKIQTNTGGRTNMTVDTEAEPNAARIMRVKRIRPDIFAPPGSIF